MSAEWVIYPSGEWVRCTFSGGDWFSWKGRPRERLEARWQIMMSAAGRVAPATERTPKLPNKRSIETDSPTDLERP